MSLRRPIAGAAWLVVQPLALNVLAVPATAYIIRATGAAGYGQWAAAAGLTAATLFLTNLGVRTLFVRRVAQQPDSAPEAFAEQLGLRTLLACGAGLVAVLACLVLRYPPVILGCTLIGAAGLLCCAIASSVSDLLYARQRLGECAGITFVAGIALTGASVVAAWAGWGPLGLAASYVVGPALHAALALLLVQRRFFPVRFRWGFGRFRELLVESRALAAQQTVGTLGANAEALLVPKLLGVAQYGFFSAGVLLPNRLTVVSDGLSTAFYPVIARRWVEDRPGVGREIRRFLALSVGGSTMLAVLCFAVADPAARILFPEAPEVCRMVIRLAAWALPLVALAEGMAYSLNACDQHARQAKLTIVAVPLGLAGTLPLILTLGLAGACWSWILREAVLVAFYTPSFLSLLTASPNRCASASPPEPAPAS